MKLGLNDRLKLNADGKRIPKGADTRSKGQRLREHPTTVARMERKKKFDALCRRYGWKPQTVRDKMTRTGMSLKKILRMTPKAPGEASHRSKVSREFLQTFEAWKAESDAKKGKGR